MVLLYGLCEITLIGVVPEQNNSKIKPDREQVPLSFPKMYPWLKGGVETFPAV